MPTATLPDDRRDQIAATRKKVERAEARVAELKEQLYDECLAAVRDGAPIAETARTAGVSRQWLHGLLNEQEEARG